MAKLNRFDLQLFADDLESKKTTDKKEQKDGDKVDVQDEYPLWPCIVCDKYEVTKVSKDGIEEYCKDGKKPVEAKGCLGH